jgi:hypothetical protein
MAPLDGRIGVEFRLIVAYVTHYQYDIFMSYSHKDDPTWIAALERALVQELRAKLGNDPMVWCDEEKLRLGQNWKDTIQESIQGSAVFVAILSPGYQVSDWCKRERKCFTDQFKDTAKMKVALKAGSAYRFLKIVKAPWEDDAHREFFSEAQDMDFFLRDASGIDRELVPGTEAFRSHVEEAAHHMAAILKAMRRKGEIIFVATPAEDAFDATNDLRNELAAQGYVVRPEGPLDKFYSDKAIKNEMQPALLSVHLLGSKYDEFAERQVRLALGLEKRLMFWLARGGIQSPDSRQRDLLESIRNAIGISSPFEVFEGVTIRNLITEVLYALKPQLHQMAQAGKTTSVYLICDRSTPEDCAFAESLRDAIQPKEGFTVLLPEVNPPNGMSIEDAHQAHLRECDGVLLYRNAAPLRWLLQQAPGVLLAEQILQRPPMKAKAFLVDKLDVLPGFPNVLLRPPTPDLGILEPFLAALRPSDVQHAVA